jgi:hypothetical protein
VLSRGIYGLLVQNLHRKHCPNLHSLSSFSARRIPLQNEEFSSKTASNTCPLGNPDVICVDYSHFSTGFLRDMGPFVSREFSGLTHKSLIRRSYTYIIANYAVTKLYIISWMYTLNSRNDMRWRKERPQKLRFALNTHIFEKACDLPALNISLFAADQSSFQTPGEVAGHIFPPAISISPPCPVVVQLESAQSHTLL